MARAKKLPSGNWRIQVSTGEKDENGRYKYISITAPTAKEANLAALEYQLKHKDIERHINNLTLYEAYSRYIENKDSILSPSTVRAYKDEQKNHLKGLMNIKIAKLTQDMIQREINKESQIYSPKTVRNTHCLLNAVLKENRPDFMLRTVLPQKAKSFIKIPELNEICNIIQVTKGTKIEIAVALALCLGLRRSEICGLKWDCVNFEKNTIIIKTAIVSGENGKLFEKKPKSYAGNRILTMPDYIVNLLQSQTRVNEYVVPLRGDYIYKKFSEILSANNINHMRFHDLRHTNASVMLLLNIPERYAMERGGWFSNDMLKNYQHTLNKEKEAINKKINDYFNNILG